MTHWELAAGCNQEVLEQLLGHLPISDVDASGVDPQGAGKGKQEGSLLSAKHLIGDIDQLLESLQVRGFTLSVLHPQRIAAAGGVCICNDAKLPASDEDEHLCPAGMYICPEQPDVIQAAHAVQKSGCPWMKPSEILQPALCA